MAATGRGPRLPAWLEELGYPGPAEQRLDIDITYATSPVRLPAGALGADKVVLVFARPELPRGLFLFAEEHDRWRLSAYGYGGNHPPIGPDGYLDFAASVAPPDLAAAIRAAEPLDSVAAHRIPATCAAATSACAGFRAGWWRSPTRSERSTRSTGGDDHRGARSARAARVSGRGAGRPRAALPTRGRPRDRRRVDAGHGR